MSLIFQMVVLKNSMILADHRFVSIDKYESTNSQRLAFENCSLDENGLNFTYHAKAKSNIVNVRKVNLTYKYRI